jgi:hypothetical protein
MRKITRIFVIFKTLYDENLSKSKHLPEVTQFLLFKKITPYVNMENHYLLQTHSELV